MSPINRRSFITHVLGAAAASALPVGHVAAAVAARSESEPFEVASGVHLLEEPRPIATTKAFAIGIDTPSGRGGDFHGLVNITANHDGTGTLYVTRGIDSELSAISHQTTVHLDAEIFRPIWETIFAKHEHIVAAAALPCAFGRKQRDSDEPIVLMDLDAETYGITPMVDRLVDSGDEDADMAAIRAAEEIEFADMGRLIDRGDYSIRSQYSRGGTAACGWSYDTIAYVRSYDEGYDVKRPTTTPYWAVRTEPIEPAWPVWMIEEAA